MTRATSARRAIADLGVSATEIDRELQAFRRSAEFLSSSRQRLVDRYEGKWIAVYAGEVVAEARSIKVLKSKLSRTGTPPDQAIFRLIEKNPRAMIL